KANIRNFWTTKYKDKTSIEPDPTPKTLAKTDDDEFERYLFKFSSTRITGDEYDTYCEEKPLPKTPPNLIQYWNGQIINSPSLAQMAMDILSIPAMAAECERVFSSAKILISDHRNRLKDDIIEANECVRYWINKGYFD